MDSRRARGTHAPPTSPSTHLAHEIIARSEIVVRQHHLQLGVVVLVTLQIEYLLPHRVQVLLFHARFELGRARVVLVEAMGWGGREREVGGRMGE